MLGARSVLRFTTALFVVLSLSACADAGYDSEDLFAEEYDGSKAEEISWDLFSDPDAEMYDLFGDDIDFSFDDAGKKKEKEDFSDWFAKVENETENVAGESDASDASVTSSEPNESVSNQSTFDSSASSMRERLTGEDTEIYDDMCDGFKSGDVKATLKGNVASDKVQYIFRCISIDHPEFFWLPYGYGGQYYTQSNLGNTLVQ